MTDTDAHVPMGTVHDMHTAAPRTIQRDFDTALIPSMRIDLTELRRLRGVLDDVEAGILAYKAREAAEAAADLEDAECCPDCDVNYIRGDEHRPGCAFGPEAYKRHRPGCVCPDCRAERETTAATAGGESNR